MNWSAYSTIDVIFLCHWGTWKITRGCSNGGGVHQNFMYRACAAEYDFGFYNSFFPACRRCACCKIGDQDPQNTSCRNLPLQHHPPLFSLIGVPRSISPPPPVSLKTALCRARFRMSLWHRRNFGVFYLKWHHLKPQLNLKYSDIYSNILPLS